MAQHSSDIEAGANDSESGAEKTAFIFPGQGSQLVGMGKDFAENFRVSALVFEEASDHCRMNLKKLCFDGPLDELTKTSRLQPALLATQAAILAALSAESESRPHFTAGHSLGEYAALLAARALSLGEAVRLVAARGAAMEGACAPGTGSMAAVIGLENAAVEALCAAAREQAPPQENTLSPANFNAPGQVVIAGHAKALTAAAHAVTTDERFSKGKLIPLQVSAPFHCALMAPAQELMAPLLESAAFQAPCCPVVANATASENEDARKIAELLARQITAPVLWAQSMQRLARLRVVRLIEIGPGKVLAGLQKRIDRAVEVINIGSVPDFKGFIGKQNA